MEAMSKEKQAELKEKYGAIYSASISYRTAAGEMEKINFIHREPTFADYERMQNEAVSLSPMTAAGNLTTSIILYPTPAEVRPLLEKCPLAFDKWFTKAITPFFGGDVVEVASQPL